jgi:hypothetical protein
MLALGMSATLSFASDLPWVSTAVRGTVIYLAGDKWEEVERDQDLTAASVRTLRSGHLSAAASGLLLEVGSSTVLELGSSDSPGASQLRHYVGTLTISGSADAPTAIIIQAGRVALTSIQGEVQVSVTSDATTLTVHSGSVLVRGTGGSLSVMTAGTYVTTAAGALVAMADVPEGGAAVGLDQGFAGSRGNASGNAAHNNAASNSNNGNGSGSNSGSGPGANSANGPNANNGGGPDASNGHGPAENNGSAPPANDGNAAGTNVNAAGQANGAANGNADPADPSNGNKGKKKDTNGETDADLQAP